MACARRCPAGDGERWLISSTHMGAVRSTGQWHCGVLMQCSHGSVRVPRQPPGLSDLVPDPLPRLPGVEAHGLRPPVPCRGR